MTPLKVRFYPFSWLKLSLNSYGMMPSSWNDVSPAQIVAIAGLMNGKCSEINFMNELTLLPKFVIKRLDEFENFLLMESLGFLNNNKMHNSIIQNKLIVGGRVFTSPKPKLKGMTFGQFIFVESHFGSYQEHNAPEELNNFIAALYRPATKKFSENQIAKYAPLFDKLDYLQKEAIVVNYLLVKEWLTASYPLIFQKPEVDTTSDQKRTPAPYDPMAWPSIFENMVGEEIRFTKNYAKLPVHTALRFITRRIKKNLNPKK